MMDRGGLHLYLRAFLEVGLILDPWLAGLTSECFSFDSLDRITRAAAELTSEYWHEPLIAETLGTWPASQAVARKATLEILSSSSAVIAHEQLGRVAVSLAMADEAIQRMERFVGRHGFGPLVRIFQAVTRCDSQAAVAHYGHMSEQSFVSGAQHRPWASGALGDELLVGLACGTYQLKVQEGRRVVLTTEQGIRLETETRQVLADSGYLEARLRLTWISHANLPTDDADAELGLWPAGPDRLTLTRFSHVRPGMDVLHAGCGAGTQMFAGGLWSAVGRDGSVTGLDPAAVLVQRARDKALALDAHNVTLVRGRAEAMPFADGQFDASVAAGLLEYTDCPQAMAEIVRVTRAGGSITVAGATDGTFDRETMRDWFQPLLQLAERYGIDPGGRVGVYGRLAAVFDGAALRDVEVAHEAKRRILSDPDRTVAEMVRGSGFLQEVLERVPWAARDDVVRELVIRGHRVCATTGPEQRTVVAQIHLARGIVTTAR